MRLSWILAAAIGVVAGAACASKGATAATPCGLTPADSVYEAYGRALYRECAVDRKAVRTTIGLHPDAPPNGARPGQCFSVDLEFVVDERGFPETNSARIIRTNNRDFGDAWLKLVPQMRYQPAKKGDVAVRQIVDEHFMASISTVVVRQGDPLPSGPPRDAAPPRC